MTLLLRKLLSLLLILSILLPGQVSGALAAAQLGEANLTPAGFNNVVLNLGAQALGAIGDGVSAVNQWRKTTAGAFAISDSLGLALDGVEC